MCFGKFVVVDYVNFCILCGEIFGFFGLNGCGKLIIMKMLIGLFFVSEGQVWLFGQLVDLNDIDICCWVGYMLQVFLFYNEFIVWQNLEFYVCLFYILFVEILVCVVQMIECFMLMEVEDMFFVLLLFGICQCLLLVVVVIYCLEMLIFDELMFGVDLVVRDMFWQFMVDFLCQDKVMIFILIYFMNEVECCD